MLARIQYLELTMAELTKAIMQLTAAHVKQSEYNHEVANNIEVIGNAVAQLSLHVVNVSLPGVN